MAVSYTNYAGVFGPNREKFFGGTTVGEYRSAPLEIDIDEKLPSQGQDPNNHFNNQDYVVIPAGRIIGLKDDSLTSVAARCTGTLANGVSHLNAPSFAAYNSVPLGYAPQKYFKNYSGRPKEPVAAWRGDVIQVPLTAANEAYCTTNNGGVRLKVGDALMPYYGSANKQVQNYAHTGKLVRWIPRRTIIATTAASATIDLAEAPFPAFKPVILAAFDASGALVYTSANTLTYNEGTSKWRAVFAGAITTVLYEYGAQDAQRVGTALKIEPVGTAGGLNGSTHHLSGWLRWVSENFGNERLLLYERRGVTSVTNEVVNISSGVGTLAYKVVVPYKPVTVTVTGTLYNDDGTTTTLTAKVLDPLDQDYLGNVIHGQYYDIDTETGRLVFTANIDVTNCTVSYSYETNYKNGLNWSERGILGLTDGSGGSNLVGLPADLDVVGVLGVLQAGIF